MPDWCAFVLVFWCYTFYQASSVASSIKNMACHIKIKIFLPTLIFNLYTHAYVNASYFSLHLADLSALLLQEAVNWGFCSYLIIRTHILAHIIAQWDNEWWFLFSTVSSSSSPNSPSRGSSPNTLSSSSSPLTSQAINQSFNPTG